MKESTCQIKGCLIFTKGIWLTGWLLASVSLASAREAGTPAGNAGATTVPKVSTANAAPATNSEEADKAWRETYKAIQSPMPPQEWQAKQPTQQEVMEYYQTAAMKGADKAKDFYTKYPDHPKAESARKAEYSLITLAVQRFGDTKAIARLTELQKQRLADPMLPESERFEIRMQAAAELLRQQPFDPDAFLKQAQALQKDFPQSNEIYQLFMQGASVAQGDSVKSLIQAVIDSPAPDEIKAQAKGMLNQMSALGQPVAIKFTAVDGRQVDLANLKGKVVLIDFWATWCGPCVGEVPTVKATYDKLHDKGFEIVGISLDKDKDALVNFTKEKGMTWPQYFDGLFWNNKISQQYGINAIPAMWLVDKKGNLIDMNGRDDLEGKVSKLLAQ
jgi:thiol-disulfide isomerase/thioredoxin